MNIYLKKLIQEYENRAKWDIRAINAVKAMLFPVAEWLSIFNNPTDNSCFAAYRSTDDRSHKIQGVMTQDKKYFFYEATPRYSNIEDYSQLMTFVVISELNPLTDSLGYAQDFLYIRSRVPLLHKKSFSTVHTYLAYSILVVYPNFKDIKSYDDFLNRYTGENGEIICRQKKVNQALNLKLSQRLKSEYDIQNIDWIYPDRDSTRSFYIDTSISHINKFTQIFLDGGIYE